MAWHRTGIMRFSRSDNLDSGGEANVNDSGCSSCAGAFAQRAGYSRIESSSDPRLSRVPNWLRGGREADLALQSSLLSIGR